MNKRLIYVGLVMLFALLAACENYIAEDIDTGNDTESDSSDYSGVNEDSTDYEIDTDDIMYIVLNGTSIIANDTSVTVDGSVATITYKGVYQISGELTDGQIIVDIDNDDDITIILNGVDITCSESAPLYIASGDKLILNLADGTENTLTDGSTYQDLVDNEPSAAFFSKADISIFGGGSLTIDANYNDGIVSKDGLIIKSGTLNIDAVDDGIRGKDYILMHDGTVTVNSGGDGFKSDNEDDADAGFITINGGDIDITSDGDAIAAVTDITINDGDINLVSGGGSNSSVSELLSAKGLKGLASVTINAGTVSVNSADDALHSDTTVSVLGGTVTLASGDDGIHGEENVVINNADLEITKSFEGIEGIYITVDESDVTIVASDDGFNATTGAGGESDDNSRLTINSGYFYINATGDALDSNGDMEINGGTVITHGPSEEPEVGVDCNGTCDVNGGFLVVSGTNSNMTEAPSTTSDQNSVLIQFSTQVSANQIVDIRDESGNDILTFAPVRSYYSIIFSSSELTQGTYTVYYGGSSTGTAVNGLYTDGTYTAGTTYETFTVSSTVTTVGSSGGGDTGGPGGNTGGPGGK
jgi:hypothetical protein